MKTSTVVSPVIISSAVSRIKKKRMYYAFTLVELMIVVAIIGILSVLAIFGMSSYLKRSKAAEATNSLGAMNRGSVMAYNRENNTATIAEGGAAGSTHKLCPASAAIPAAPPANTKYTAASAADYVTDPGFTCLGFQLSEPQAFNYQYNPGALALNTPDIGSQLAVPATGWAVGSAADLNGDGTLLEFATGGDIRNGTPETANAIASWDTKSGAPF